MDTELEKVSKSVDAAVRYRGVTFQKITVDNECFRKREEYPYLNLEAQKYAKIKNEDNELHMGFHMNIEALENNPEQLLQVGKGLFKEGLFEFYENIKTVKSKFPYKYAYPISTTLSQDQEY
jgi:hypothetical protein